MSEPTTPSPTAVAPEAYISGRFQEACQEISANPQEVFSMLLYGFMKIAPEDRGAHFRGLKKDFNVFAAAVDFPQLQKAIDSVVESAELQLHDALMEQQEAANAPALRVV